MARLSSTLPSCAPSAETAYPSAPRPAPQPVAQPLTVVAQLPDGRRWPCVVRLSARARRCRLRVDARGVVTLVVPQKNRLSPSALQSLLDNFTPWLTKTLTRLLGPQAQPPLYQGEHGDGAGGGMNGGAHGPAPTLADIPASLSLPLSGMVWHIYIVSTTEKTERVTLREETHMEAGGGRIELRGPSEHPAFAGQCCQLLQRWLRAQATRWLPPRLRLLAARMGAEVGRVTVRAQRGRWGSCSSRGDISLNCLLLLLPLPLLDHVCWHELCHLRHMDHSRRYRAHLALHAPQWQWREKALNTAWRQMPLWALWRG